MFRIQGKRVDTLQYYFYLSNIINSKQTASPAAEMMRYNPPWPRGQQQQQQQQSFVPPDNLKPYLKPLPKPPGKESPNRPHRKMYQNPNQSNAQSRNSPPMALRQQNMLQQKAMPEIFRPRPAAHSPLHGRKSPRRHSPLQRHYSDESLSGGFYGSGGVPQRIHSSADEISSLNHSPSISSSDESYSRTTDADASPCVSPPLPADTQQFLFPSDIQVSINFTVYFCINTFTNIGKSPFITGSITKSLIRLHPT